MKLRIEKASEKNIPQIISLIREFAAFENLSDCCEVTEKDLRKALSGKTKVAEALVVFEAQTPIAYAIFYPCFASFRGQRGLHLEDIYIKQEFRGRQIGEMMLKYLARIAKRRGFERIDFQVLEWNTPAVEFYKKHGAEVESEERHFKFVGEAFENLAA